MQQCLVITLLADDRTGLVESIARMISQHQGNWLESNMAQLAGKFAGILRVSIAVEQIAALSAALRAETDWQIQIATELLEPQPSAYTRSIQISLMAHDRVGIVRELSAILAASAVNVQKLTTFCASAPMSGEQLFNAMVEAEAEPSLNLAALKIALEGLSDDAMVDVAERI